VTETGWLFGHWNASCGECPGNHVVKSMVSSSFGRCLLTDEAVQATGINWCSAAALMRDAEVEAQPWADCHPDSLII